MPIRNVEEILPGNATYMLSGTINTPAPLYDCSDHPLLPLWTGEYDLSTHAVACLPRPSTSWVTEQVTGHVTAQVTEQAEQRQ